VLSRVAERLYWMARYLERAEDTARLVNAYSHLILDLPHGAEPGWDILLNTFDASGGFSNRYKLRTERNVVKYLLADLTNESSIRYALKAARENVRTTRDVLPAETWELVNECYLYVDEMAPRSLARSSRFVFMEQMIARNQQITGMVQSTILRDHALWFMRLGRLLERADMTSRIIDVGVAAILNRSGGADAEIPLLWTNLLTSLSAKSAYWRSVGPLLTANDVVDFIFKNKQFPRSILYCVNEIEDIVAQLRGPPGMLRSIRRIARVMSDFEAESTTLDELHELIDHLQGGLAELNTAFDETWFAPPG